MPLYGCVVDVLFPEERVIVEVDSWEFHRFRANFEDDRKRGARMLAIGHLTVPLTDERMKLDAAAEADRLNTILEYRRHAA